MSQKLLNLNEEFQRYGHTFSISDSGYIAPRVEIDAEINGAIEICGYKLERYETPTDWTPAIEDYERNTLSYPNMETSTATHSYNVGDFVEVDGSLKKVTSTIAQGQTFSSSNTKDTTITDELKAIYALINK